VLRLIVNWHGKRCLLIIILACIIINIMFSYLMPVYYIYYTAYIKLIFARNGWICNRTSKATNLVPVRDFRRHKADCSRINAELLTSIASLMIQYFSSLSNTFYCSVWTTRKLLHVTRSQASLQVLCGLTTHLALRGRQWRPLQLMVSDISMSRSR